jgi:hypothetical protein
MPEELNNGTIENRGCTDILFCILFILFIGGCVVIAAFGFTKGNPNLLIYPYDEDGYQCGYKKGEQFPYLYFYNSVDNVKDFNTTGIAQGVCVKDCPEVYKETLDCMPTLNNPYCKVTNTSFYSSMPCIYILTLSFETILYTFVQFNR